MNISRRNRKPRGKRGTSVKDRVEPLLRERGIDTSTLAIATPSRGGAHWVVIEGRVIGVYDHMFDTLQLDETTKE